MADTENEVIEFLDGDSVKLGLVHKRGSSRIQVTDQQGKQHSLNSRQVLLSHVSKVSAADFLDYAREYSEKVQVISDDIDTELLWESIDPKGAEFKPEKAAEVYFADSETISLSAVIRAAMADQLFFRRKGQHLTLRTEEQVEEQRHLLRKKEEKENLNEQFTAWAESLLEPGEEIPEKCDERFIPLLNSLEQALSNPEYELDPWLRRLISRFSGPFRSRAEVIVMLLAAGERVPEGADPFILESGLPLEFSDEAKEETARLKASWKIDLRPEPLRGLVFSIDDPDTDEIDDALSVSEQEFGYLVGIHVADAGAIVPRDSVLDREASERNTSVYLPHRRFRMIPEEISCGLASLKSATTRKTVSCYLKISPSLEILDWNFSENNLVVAHNLTYELADSIISGEEQEDPGPEYRKALVFLEEFTASLLEKRAARGAVIINRPELKIIVNNEKIKIDVLNTESLSRRVVSELMILYNSLGASLAAGEGPPLVFRGQNQPDGDIPKLPEKGYDNFAAYRLFSVMEPGFLSLEPAPHFGLGVDCYAQLTSPIRRYSDLLNQRQLKRLLASAEPAYSGDELSAFVPGIRQAEKRARKLERRMNRLFTLRYLTRKKKEAFDLVVLQQLKDGFLVETKSELIRGILRTNASPAPGERLEGKIERVDPESDILVFSG